MEAPLREHFPGAADFTFRFRLAAELGMTAGEVGSRMTPVELEGWRAYYQLADEAAADAAKEMKS